MTHGRSFRRFCGYWGPLGSLTIQHFSSVAPRAAVLFVLLSLASCTTSSSQGGAPVPNRDSDSRVQSYSLAPVFIDESGATNVRAAFPVRNYRDQAVTVTALKGSCGCAAAELDSREIAPFDATTLRLSVNMTGKIGPQRITCDLFDGDGLFCSCVIATTGYRAASFETENLHLGNIRPGEDANIHLMTYGRDADSLPRLRTVSCDDRSVTCAADSEPTIDTDANGIVTGTYCVKLQTSLDAPAGATASFVTAVVDSNGGERTAHARVRWTVGGVFEIEPRLIFFPAAAQRPKKVVIRRLDKRPTRVLKCSTTHPAIQVSIDDSTDPLELLVRIDPSKLTTRVLSSKLLITTGDAVQPEVAVRVVAAPSKGGRQ